MTTWHEIKLMFGNFTSARKTILHCDNITKLPRIANGWYLFFSLLCVVFQIGGNPLYELSDDPWQKSKDIFVTTVPIQPHSTSRTDEKPVQFLAERSWRIPTNP